jgi:ubiquinone/menaquinone biosynthesis C-methylase UbiE
MFGHTSILIKRIFNSEVYVTDFFDVWQERFRREGINFSLCELTSQSLPFEDNSFDIVLFCEVIEHLFILPHLIFLDIRRVLKRNGLLILTTPNLYSVDKRICFLLGKRVTPRLTANGDEVTAFHAIEKSCRDNTNLYELIQTRKFSGTHVREYDMAELRSLLQETGFKISSARCLQADGIIPRINGTRDFNPKRVFCRLLGKAYAPWGNQIFIAAQKE